MPARPPTEDETRQVTRRLSFLVSSGRYLYNISGGKGEFWAWNEILNAWWRVRVMSKWKMN